MKENPLYDTIDHRFIKAVDEVIAVNKELGITPIRDSAIGRMVYPSNRSIISSVRSRTKHIPHVALINFAKQFKVDMNYFYDDNASLQYQPKMITNIIIKGNGIHSTGNNTTNITAGNGRIKGIHTAQAGSKNTLVEVIEVSTMINNFISQIDSDRIQQFLAILSQIQSENKAAVKKLEKILQDKSKEIEEIRASFKEEIQAVRGELKETRVKLDEALKSEVDLLRQLLALKK